jgi:hypothetical protein
MRGPVVFGTLRSTSLEWVSDGKECGDEVLQARTIFGVVLRFHKSQVLSRGHVMDRLDQASDLTDLGISVIPLILQAKALYKSRWLPIR